MPTINDGGPAFPVPELEGGHAVECQGMSIRDVFAAHALAGLVTQYSLAGLPPIEPKAMAAKVYELADALLAARKAAG